MVTSTTRSANACESCRRRKVKCSGEQPCSGCIKHNWECAYAHTGRKRYSEAQVKRLLEKIQNYEVQLGVQSEVSSVSSQTASDPVPSRPAAQPEPAASNNPITPGNHSPSNQRSNTLAYDDSVSSISPATDLTPGPAFESQVRSLLDRSTAYSHLSRGVHHNENQTAGYAAQWTSLRGLDDADDPLTPSMEESQYLLDQFLYYMGVSQHFIDPRSFSDSMVLLFQTRETREQQKRTTWYTEYLLVMAMAKLIEGEQPKSQPPGSDLFAEALRRLPPLHKLGGEGVIAVEILTLAATYLQWCDRRHDAYLYIGMAMRLAIALGCNIPENKQACLPSQSAHRVRLWWTVYMLDRRLSSGLGLAAGADERQLQTGLPRHAVGFPSPVPITINVRIARITDDIMCSLYGNASITQLELVGKIQDILQELYDIGKSFSQSLIIDFNNQQLEKVTRTGSSLYLMLFQAIILCTRPILLRRVRLQVQRKQESLPAEVLPEVLARLCDTCYEASTRSLAILYSLRQQKLIPRYGFFDLDATFSAAFVLVMTGVTEYTQDQPPLALEQAFDVLQFLALSGNFAAEQRFQDIAQSCSRVWPNYVIQGSPSNDQTTQIDPASQQQGNASSGNESGKNPLSNPFAASNHMSAAQDLDFEHHSLEESRLLEAGAHSGASGVAFDMEGDWGMDLADEAERIYSSFHSPVLPLTGVDYMDWLEIEKVFNFQGGA
ncbi:hypothetical protein N7456_010942 [Penicillium angulare]|uniref:Zn(2)-C6 fungal-type domain-containing protein n=1 Tax=Penicillium angulare TaxID=116970 RepID=A0A9W9ET05_9EURO|nr:hypothetical protein N7456_010942 [Penicillium angulare]